MKVVYDYYGQKRVTPLYLPVLLFEAMTYSDFTETLKVEVPHLQKLDMIRLQCRDDELDIDLNPERFVDQVIGASSRSNELMKVAITVLDGCSPAVNKTGVKSPGMLRTEASATFVPKKLEFMNQAQDTLPGNLDFERTNSDVFKLESPGSKLKLKMDKLKEQQQHLIEKRAKMEAKLLNLSRIPEGLEPDGYMNIICQLCHRRGHRADGNKKKEPCSNTLGFFQLWDRKTP